MSPLLSGIILFLLGYIIYLRLQLHIQQRIVSAFQSAAVVVPPAARPRSEARAGLLLAAGALFLAAAGCAALFR